MNTITTTLLDGEKIGDAAYAAMEKLFDDVIGNLDEKKQLQFFCGAWGRFEAMAIIGKPITTHDVSRMRESYNEIIAKHENTWPCDCGADLNDAEILSTTAVQCRECRMIKNIGGDA